MNKNDLDLNCIAAQALRTLSIGAAAMAILPAQVTYGVTALVLSYLIKKFIFSKHKLPLPPGPKGLPIVGNVMHLPPAEGQVWQHWLKHKALYGPMSSVTVFGQTIVLIHSLKLVLELLDKRGAKYSSRAQMVFAGEMCGYNERMPFRDYDNIFRHQRKLMGGQIGSRQAITRFHSAMELEARRFLLRTLAKPGDVIQHLETESGSLMLKMLYGYTPSPHKPDPLVSLINTVMAEFGQAVVVGAWSVDMIPWLRYLPDWVPGTGFKQTARQWKKDSDDSMNVPADFVSQQMANKTANTSFVERLFSDNPDAEETEHIKQSAAALYAGGADSTAAGLAFFILAMTTHPEAQRKAREEIDRVVGAGRLPAFHDRESLPYVEAIVKETLRWQPLAPLSPPHVSEQEDEIEGYRIPKGALIMANIKWLSMDPAVYGSPEQFRPERFLGPNEEPSPYAYVFGFGRRICPGRLLADSSMFLTIAQALAVFDISKATNEETGEVIEPVVGIQGGLVSHPLPFQCSIKPRSNRHIELIKATEAEHPWEQGDAESLRGLSV